MTNSPLLDRAKAVLNHNDHGTYTVPSEGLYPHQVLWDSCFIAIGRRHYDPKRAQVEIETLLAAQWKNGMVPNIVFSGKNRYFWDRWIWRSWMSPLAPTHVATSGITQPPMIAEAVVKTGEMLQKTARLAWYRRMYPQLVAYHEWLVRERTDDEGLVTLLHPWEAGLDNTPPAMITLGNYQGQWWLQAVKLLHLDALGNLFRWDTKLVPLDQRSSNVEALTFFSLLRKLRHNLYDSPSLMINPGFAVQDVTYNSIFIRANTQLGKIADELGETLPRPLRDFQERAAKNLEQLWDEASGQYYSRDSKTDQLLREPSIATLMPLYAGIITAARAKQLAEMVEKGGLFDASYPIPSVPLNSSWFRPKRYWQGPTWVNTNWLVIQGLREYGFKEAADNLTKQTLELVEQNGFYEYFDPNTGKGAGTNTFSWTAGLVIDLLENAD